MGDNDSSYKKILWQEVLLLALSKDFSLDSAVKEAAEAVARFEIQFGE